jgi:hypothetical protein
MAIVLARSAGFFARQRNPSSPHDIVSQGTPSAAITGSPKLWEFRAAGLWCLRVRRFAAKNRSANSSRCSYFSRSSSIPPDSPCHQLTEQALPPPLDLAALPRTSFESNCHATPTVSSLEPSSTTMTCFLAPLVWVDPEEPRREYRADALRRKNYSTVEEKSRVPGRLGR